MAKCAGLHVESQLHFVLEMLNDDTSVEEKPSQFKTQTKATLLGDKISVTLYLFFQVALCITTGTECISNTDKI